MSNGLCRDLIYGLNKQITGTGSLGIGNVKDESKVRFAISQAGPANVIRIRARIIGQVQYTSASYAGFVSGTIRFRAITTSV
jgi:hypothetical protein